MKGVLVEWYLYFENVDSYYLIKFFRCTLSDPAMKQFLLHLDEKLALGRKFIIQDLDENHLFISTDIVEVLQARVDELMDRISFPLHEKDA